MNKTVKKLIILFCGFLSLCGLFLTLGCSSEENYDGSSQDVQDSSLNEVQLMVNDFNRVANLDFEEVMLSVNSNASNCTISLGSELDICLESLCENYMSSNSNSELITVSQIRTALTEDLDSTIERYANEKEEYFLYKFFSWCGLPAAENVVYQGEENEREKYIKLLRDLENYKIVISEYEFSQEGKLPVFKFKWQQ